MGISAFHRFDQYSLRLSCSRNFRCIICVSYSTGHPVHSLVLDPRHIIFQLWKKGGYLEGTGKFTPHFIAREVRKRNEWVQSADIHERLKKLHEAQNKAKDAERKVISEHDYTNILHYFSEMSSLRKQETAMRDYLIGELEIARAKLDSTDETAKMHREQLAESEMYYMKVTEALNTKLGHVEYAYKKACLDNIDLQKQLYRMSNILDSYIETERNRSAKEGGTLQALKPRHFERVNPSLQEVFTKLQDYRDQRDRTDDLLRERARCHVEEIDFLSLRCARLEYDLAESEKKYLAEKTLCDKLTQTLMMSERSRAALIDEHHHQAKIGWKSASHSIAKLSAQEVNISKLKPLLFGGIVHSQSLVSKFSWTVIKTLNLLKPDELNSWNEMIAMKKEDLTSQLMNMDGEGSNPLLTKSGKGSKSKKGRRSSTSSSKKPGSAASGTRSETDSSVISSTTKPSKSDASAKKRKQSKAAVSSKAK